MLTLQHIFSLHLSEGKQINTEKDIYAFLKKHVFVKSYKLYCPVLRGMPDFLVIKANYNLPSGFYEVKNKTQLTQSQIKLLSELCMVFDCIVVKYNKQEHKLDFYKVGVTS